MRVVRKTGLVYAILIGLTIGVLATSWSAGVALIVSLLVCFVIVLTIGGMRARRTVEKPGELEQLKSDFVSHVSHELKAPLASMQETIHILLEQIPGPLNDKQRRMLTLNLESNHRLGAMIGNLLDIARIEAGTMEYDLQTRDLTSLVRSAAAEVETRSREKPVNFKMQLPEGHVFTRCDRDRLIQAISNVIDNALKFSAKEARVSIRLEHRNRVPETIPGNYNGRLQSTNGESGFALVSVMDRGSGIAGQDKEKVFGKFHQARGPGNTAVQGAGLGLAISRAIVEAHGGAIWVEDNPGGGSIFQILLKAVSGPLP